MNFDPSIGGETHQKRSAAIASNDASNGHLNRLQVVPLTSNIFCLYPSEAYVVVGGEPRKATADQLTTVSKRRLIRRMGVVSQEDVQKVEHAIETQLGLS